MSKIKLLAAAFSLLVVLLAGCKTSAAYRVANQIDKINDFPNKNSLQFLDEALQDKQIIILGEASHGDGKTFAVKSQLVEHLFQNKNFNSVALESRDFFEIEIINGQSSVDPDFDKTLKTNWVRQWNPWGPSVEIEMLVQLFSTTPLKSLGLETYNNRSFPLVIMELKKRLTDLDFNSFSDAEWARLQEIHNDIIGDIRNVSPERMAYYLQFLEKLLIDMAEKDDNQSLFLAQMAENTITYVKLKQLKTKPFTDDIENESINLRDLQMAKNLIWYKKRNPDVKIVVWIANFHAANQLSKVEFAGDTQRYSKFIVFGEHIKKKYGKKVLSLAFTSSRGTSKLPYNFEGIEETKITTSENSLEKALDVKNVDLGYINFERIRNRNAKLSNEKFLSSMLGYVSQDGQWLKVFDGVIYIKENAKATAIN